MPVYTAQSASQNKIVVQKINEYFHDVEAEVYVNNHPEIFNYEADSWRILFSDLKNKEFTGEHVTILDIGSGTGFVPLTISKSLNPEDLVIVSDISRGMLKQASENLKDCVFEKLFIKVDDGYNQINDNSVDIITLNSVLHHIPDIKALFNEFNRMLKPGGYLIIKHEPNIRFGKNKVLHSIFKFLRRIQIRKNSEIVSVNPISKRVIEKLSSDNISFEPPLTDRDLQSLVDIHSPTAKGSFDLSRGFDPYNFSRDYFVNSYLYKCSTYGYFGKIRDNANFIRKTIALALKIAFPKDGYFFDAVIRKNK